MNTRLLVGTSNCSNVKPEFYFSRIHFFRRPSVVKNPEKKNRIFTVTSMLVTDVNEDRFLVTVFW